VLHSYRERKTGPCFSLIVLRCKTHQCFFTLYPLGYLPYMRQPLTQDGLFGVATDVAANGLVNDLPAEGERPLWRRTRWAWLALCGLWLGFAANQAKAEQAAFELGISAHEHREHRLAFLAHTPMDRAKAVCRAWALIPDEPWRRLLRVGYVMGLCGCGFELDERGVLHRLAPFCQRE